MENKFGLRVIDMKFSSDAPVIKTTHGKDWVLWGENNLYPQYLLNLYHNYSVTHKQIINRKVKMGSSAGLDKPINPSQAYIDFIENKFGDMSIEEMIVKLFYDITIFNGVSLNPHWNVDGTGLTRLCYIPFERVRQDKGNRNTDDGLPNYLWLSDNWCKIRDNEPQKYIKFDQRFTSNRDERSQIFYYTMIDQGIKFYPDVEYSPATNFIEAAWEIGNYHNNAIKNGFHAGFVLNFGTGIPTEEEMDRAYEDIGEKFVGSSNANKYLLTWSNGKDGAPQLTPVPMNNSDTKFMELNELIRNNIFEAHEVVNPTLFGIPSEGQLGGRTELLEALAIYQATYIDGKQKVIEDILNKFAKLSGVDIEKEPIKIKKYKMDIPQIEGYQQLTMADTISLLSSIKTGQMDVDTASSILTTVYGLSEDKVKKLLNKNNKV